MWIEAFFGILEGGWEGEATEENASDGILDMGGTFSIHSWDGMASSAAVKEEGRSVNAAGFRGSRGVSEEEAAHYRSWNQRRVLCTITHSTGKEGNAHHLYHIWW
jgi:hypothetical protein